LQEDAAQTFDAKYSSSAAPQQAAELEEVPRKPTFADPRDMIGYAQRFGLQRLPSTATISSEAASGHDESDRRDGVVFAQEACMVWAGSPAYARRHGAQFAQARAKSSGSHATQAVATGVSGDHEQEGAGIADAMPGVPVRPPGRPNFSRSSRRAAQ